MNSDLQKVVLLPDDIHNRNLLENVRPADWQNPMPQGRYNLVVIGAGVAGLIAASAAAGLGAKVALIERHLLGGDCLNVGCVPSKALLRAARAYADVRDAKQFGISSDFKKVDFSLVMEHMRRLRAAISPNDSAARYRNLGVDVYFGHAAFTGRRSVQVGDRELRFTKAIIATGGRAAAPAIDGIEQAGYLTNETVFSLTELPRRLAVIGAGPIGCELAQAFARFGSQVYLIEAMHGVLPNEDRDAGEIVLESLRRDGVQLVCCGKDLRISRREDGKHLSVNSHDQHYDISVDEILVGVGRTPNIDGLKLELAGVRFDQHGVHVNDRLQTTNRHIYAAGDVCSRFKFTHAADAMARIVVQNALFFGRSRVSMLKMPWCTYTDPEVAHVGLYQPEAEKQGIAIRTYEHRLHDVDRAVLDGEQQGFIRVHVKSGTDRIVGATIVARHAGEMISEITLAMVANLGLRSIARTIHPYPTQAEMIKKVADAYNRTRLTPMVKAIAEKWLAFRR